MNSLPRSPTPDLREPHLPVLCEALDSFSTFAAGLLLAVPVAPMIASQLGAKVTALAIMKSLADSGWIIRDGAIDELGQGESKVYPVTLYYGNTYKIIAAGDEDAADVDIGVFTSVLPRANSS